MYLVFTHMHGESYRRRLRSLLLYLCYVFRGGRASKGRGGGGGLRKTGSE